MYQSFSLYFDADLNNHKYYFIFLAQVLKRYRRNFGFQIKGKTSIILDIRHPVQEIYKNNKIN